MDTDIVNDIRSQLVAHLNSNEGVVAITRDPIIPGRCVVLISQRRDKTEILEVEASVETIMKTTGRLIELIRFKFDVLFDSDDAESQITS